MPWPIGMLLGAFGDAEQSVGEWIVELGRKRAGLLMLVAAFGTGITAGSAAVLFVSDFTTWGPRIAALEDRMDAHVDTITTPAMDRLARIERRHDAFEARWERMWDREWDLEQGGRLAVMAEQTHQMYCSYWPDRCRPVPREED
jgi:hypothetical protein